MFGFGSTAMKVAKSNNDLGATNKVYFHPKFKSPDLIQIPETKFIYRTDYSNIVAVGDIAMNGKQREINGKKEGDQIVFKSYTSQIKQVGLLTLQIDTKTKCIIDCEEFVSTMKSCMGIQPLSSTQQFIILYQGSAFTCTVQQIELDDNTESVLGMFCHDTNCVFTSTKAYVEFRNQFSPSGLFKKNLDLQTLGIGGLDREFQEMFRRAFVSRMQQEVARKMGIQHTKGILLYGPPGCGKTLLARELGKLLNCEEPKIVCGPELINSYQGKSEENVRNLFAEAMVDNSGSKLYLIICDEFDALCKQRGSDRGGTGVGDNIVNQFLTMIDGPTQLNNILLICMTNRKDLIDDAILRAGRIEVHIEIQLPDQKGREEILTPKCKYQRLGKLDKELYWSRTSRISKRGVIICIDERSRSTRLQIYGEKSKSNRVNGRLCKSS